MGLGKSRAILPFGRTPRSLDGCNPEAPFLLAPDLPCDLNDPSYPSDRGIFQATIDNLPDQVALVDGAGRIAMVNQGWAGMARTFHLGPFGVGDNYRQVCLKFAEYGYEIGFAVLRALDEFDEGLRSHSEHTYSIPGPQGESFYKVVLSSIELQRTRFIAVSSQEITDLVMLKRRNRELERERLSIQQREGRRIGREIHDTTAQELSVLNLSVERLRSLHSDKQSLEVFGVIDSALTHVIDEIRTISFMLHPPSLDHGLVEALNAMSRGFARRTKLAIGFTFGGEIEPWGEEIEQALYRIAQEALTNVYRHAQASQITVRLISRRNALHLVIEDDGIGMSPQACKVDAEGGGVGIASMRSRMLELSGRLSIQSRKAGCRVTASIPLPAAIVALRSAS
ncbi:sensor histidine kinase [Novosphingobium sp. G106]|uniref:sensor histidine kinase n=1 Tax=Novosphingobium sp. G106 TaxID=2849500 RepID=UPI001C2D1356|nr:sensor histidine kinase [Novosphingobium sp. G106]MBV1686670.1 sensor histidine kinase [Novosphingobium sp. G106]